MNELRDDLQLPSAPLADPQNLPVPVAATTRQVVSKPKPQRFSRPVPVESGTAVQGVVFACAALTALTAGVASPAAGAAVLALGLLATVTVDFMLWRQDEARQAFG
jgi:hypothetical protein